jgi:hypothetical protein
LINNYSILKSVSLPFISRSLIIPALIYFLISEFTKKSKAYSPTLKENYQEIQATYEQLIAAEEELRAQFDELHEKQSR